MGELEDQILSMITDNDGMTRLDIQNKLNLDRHIILAALYSLRDKNLVICNDNGPSTKKGTVRKWRLT